MKKLFLITLATVLMSSLVLSGCAQAPPPPKPSPVPAPAPAPAPVPAAKPAPASAPSPPAPAATPGTAPVKPIELRFSHHNPPTGRTTVMMLNPFAKKIEEATKGRVKVVIYPAETLAKSAENIEATVSGLADMAWLILGNWTGRFPLTEVMNLPFIALSGGKVDKRSLSSAEVNSRILEELYEKLPEIQAEFANLKVLFLHTSDTHFLVTTKKQVSNLDGIKGMKIRVLGRYPMEMWKMLGAAPVLLAAPDVFDAAQKGVIDGMAVNWGLLATFRFYEVCKYYTDAPVYVNSMAMVMNKEKWNSLPPDIQQAIMSVSGVSGAEFAGEQSSGTGVKDDVAADMKRTGKILEKIDLDSGEYDKWKNIAGKPLWDRWIAEMKGKALAGQKVYDETLRLIEKYKS